MSPKASKSNSPDDRLVYLAFRHIFSGADAQVRQPKVVNDRIAKHKQEPSVRALIQQHDVDSIRTIILSLLKDGVFKSTLSAKVRFPEIFDVSPAQSAEREMSEAEAARNEATAMLNAVGSSTSVNAATQGIANETTKEPSKQSASVATGCSFSSSLYPAYITLPSQLSLLRAVQDTLEHACFALAQAKLPKVLEGKGWTCAEAVELNIWAKVLTDHKSELGEKFAEQPGRSMAEIMSSIANIRHTVVHRIPVTVDRVLELLVCAELFADMLDDSETIKTISKWRRKAQDVVEEMKRNKNLLEAKIQQLRRHFEKQRLEIDEEERTALENVKHEDVEMQKQMSRTVDTLMISRDGKDARSQSADWSSDADASESPRNNGTDEESDIGRPRSLSDLVMCKKSMN